MKEPLTTEVFGAAIRAGRGRAYLHVRQFGLAAVADLVLAACLKDQRHDPECEESRASWLFSMVDGAKEYPSFSSAIVNALERETNTWDSEQLCELAALMAKNGDAKAHEALRARAFRQAETAGSDDDWVGAASLLSVDGLSAVPDLVRRYGRSLRNDPKSEVPDLDFFADSELLLQAEVLLRELAESDPDISKYMAEWQQERVERDRWAREYQNTPIEARKAIRRERLRRELPLEKVLLDASTEKGDFPDRYMQFGRIATSEELAAVLRRLEEESVEGICKRLLWVFRRTALPRVPPKIWEMAASSDRELRSAAAVALAQLADPRVGEFGRSRLRSHSFTEHDSAILDLFIRNYVPGDEDLIMKALSGLTPTPENGHSLCWSLLDIAGGNASIALLPLLNWAYEETPCSNCRFRTLEFLRDFGGISQEIIGECLFDVHEGSRQLAKEVEESKEV